MMQEVTHDVKTLYVDAGVRYWEDAKVNGIEDTEHGDNIPCKEGERWRPIIDIEAGIITNWERGKTADIHYKVCDDGVYTLKDADGNVVISIDDYVPNCMCPCENGYGDYIIMHIEPDGKITRWEHDFSDFSN